MSQISVGNLSANACKFSARQSNIAAVKPLMKICGIPFLLVAMFALVLAYVWFFGRATYLVWLMKQEAVKDPTLATIPVPLLDASISNVPGATRTHFGYQFEVPWRMKEPKGGRTLAIIQLQSGHQVIIFFDPAEKQGFVKIMKDSLTARVDELALIYGREALRSDYDFDRAVVNASPSQLSYIYPGRKEIRAASLLIMKPTETINAETGIYSFQTARLRGFQNGDPSRANTVRVKAFDSDDHQFEFVFGNKAYPDAGLTQADINKGPANTPSSACFEKVGLITSLRNYPQPRDRNNRSIQVRNAQNSVKLLTLFNFA